MSENLSFHYLVTSILMFFHVLFEEVGQYRIQFFETHIRGKPEETRGLHFLEMGFVKDFGEQNYESELEESIVERDIWGICWGFLWVGWAYCRGHVEISEFEVFEDTSA